MEKKTFQVPNIGCNGCVNTIKSELGSLDGVVTVDGAVDTKTVTIEFNEPASWEKIVDTLKEIDYAPAQS